MASSSVNLFLGKREYFDKATYWKVDSNNRDYNSLIHETKPTATFSCRELNAKTYSNSINGGMFQFSNSDIQIQTKSQIDIKQNDLVKFRENYWIVLNVQKKTIHKQEQFKKHPYYITTIALRGTDYE